MKCLSMVLLISLLLGFGIYITPNASAALVTVEFAGHIVSDYGESITSSGTIPPDTPFTGYYTFDTVPSTVTLQTSSTEYRFANHGRMYVSIGKYLSLPSLPSSYYDFHINIWNDDYNPNTGHISDIYTVSGTDGNMTSGEANIIWISMNDSSGQALSSTDLPSSAPRLSDFDSNRMRIHRYHERRNIFGVLERIAVVPNPPEIDIDRGIDCRSPEGLMAGSIGILAGAGAPGFTGDGLCPSRALFYYPRGLALDGRGGLYIADQYNRRVRGLTRDGILSTVAGTGGPGAPLDGGPAVKSPLSPYGLAVDHKGALYITDPDRNQIRRMDIDGTLSLIAGSGEAGFSGDGGPALKASLNGPQGIAIDGTSTVYLADTRNHRIRRIDPTGTIATAAGGGNEEGGWPPGTPRPAVEIRLNAPRGLALDAKGNLFVADVGNHRILRIDPAGEATVVAGGGDPPDGLGDGGPAVRARLWYPADVAVDAAGRLYVADTSSHRIRMVETDGTIRTVAGGGKKGDQPVAVETQLVNPQAVEVDDDYHLYIADESHRILKVFGIPPGGSGEAAATLQIRDTTFPHGWVADVVLTMETGAKGLFAGSLRIEAGAPDPARAPPLPPIENAAGGSLLPEIRWAINPSPGGGARVAFTGSDPVDGPGNLLTLKVPIPADAPAGTRYPLRLKEVRLEKMDGTEIPVLTKDATLTIVKPTLGDATGDGKLAVSDVTLALRILTGQWKPQPGQFAVADVNGDGVVNTRDATFLLRVVVGLAKLPG